MPFGEVRNLPDLIPISETDFGFTGQRAYTGFGLIDYRARFYSPYLNRFIQPDSIVPNLTNSQSWNRFSYVNNSPVMYNDPTGHMAEGECGYYGCGNVNTWEGYRPTRPEHKWPGGVVPTYPQEPVSKDKEGLFKKIGRIAGEFFGIITIVHGVGNRKPVFESDVLEFGSFDAERVKYGDAPLYLIAEKGLGITGKYTTTTVTFNPHFAVSIRYQVAVKQSENYSSGYGGYAAYEGTNGNSLFNGPTTSAEIGAYSYSTTVSSVDDVTGSTTSRVGVYASTKYPEEFGLGLGVLVFGPIIVNSMATGGAATALELALQPK